MGARNIELVCEIYVIGQIIPLMKQRKNISDYCPGEEEVKMLIPKCSGTNGDFIGLEKCVMHLVVHGDFLNVFHQVMTKFQILLLGTWFHVHMFIWLHGPRCNDFFLPSIAKLNLNLTRTMEVVKLIELSEDLKDILERFEPTVLDAFDLKRAEVRLSVLNVLEKMADFSSENLKVHAENIALCS